MIKRHDHALLLISTSIYFLAMYMMPEQIRLETAVFAALLLLSLFAQKTYQYNKFAALPLIVFVILGIIQMPFSAANTSDSIEILIALAISFLLLGVDYTQNCRTGVIKAILLTSCVAVIGCILQLVAVDALRSINRVTLGPDKYEIFDMFYRGRQLVGFSFQTAVTGFYLTLLVGYLGSRLFSKTITGIGSRIWTAAALIATYALLFFTGKRIFILLSLIGILVVLAVFNRKHFFKILLGAALLFVGAWALLTYTEQGQLLLTRSEAIDPTTGRMAIYAQLMAWFWQHPIFGNGLNSTLTLLPNYQNGHNVYLQLLTETGVVGFSIMAIIFVTCFYKSLKLLRYCVINRIECVTASFCVFVQIVFLGWCLTGNPLYDVYPLLVYMIINGIVLKMSKEYCGGQKNENRNSNSLL